MSMPRLPFLLLTVSLAFRQRSQKKQHKLKVMPLGDSITFGCGDGCDGNGCGGQCFGFSNPTCTAGYRSRLWSMLSPEGRSSKRWEFVGTIQSGNETAMDPRVQAKHGNRIGDLIRSKELWVPLQPDIILLHIGTNNLGVGMQRASYALTWLTKLLDTILEDIPGVRVFMSTIIGAYKYGQEKHEEYNAGIKALATAYAANGHRVTLVDMANDAGLGNCELEFCCDHFAGRVHPNGAGYDRIAGVWYKALKALA